MTMNGPVVVVGQGEIGRPLLEILSRSYECIGVDIEPVDAGSPCSVLHIATHTNRRFHERYGRVR